MATTKELVMNYLKIVDLGNEVKSDQKIKGKIAAFIKKADGSKNYAAVKWNDVVGKYVLIYDPAPGISVGILSVFSPEIDKIDEIIDIVTSEIQKEEEPEKIVSTIKRGRPAVKKK